MLDMVLPRSGAFTPASPPSPVAFQTKPGHRFGYSYLLLFRFALVNLVATALVAMAWMEGWVDILRASDPTRLTVVTAGLFLVGLALCGFRIWKVSQELNEVRAALPSPGSKVGRYLTLVRAAGAEGRAVAAEALRLTLTSRIIAVRQIASTLVILGLLGTVVGFIISLGGVKPEVAGDAKAVTPMIATLIQGMSVALGNTLVGGVLNLWLIANYHILATGTARLIGATFERGVTDVAR
jgi:hypothetical protein